MKYSARTLALFSFFAIIASCGQNGNNKPAVRDYIVEELAEKDRLRKQYADSTVSLSFSGIKLNESFRSTLSAAQKAGTIRKLKYDKGGESATCQADIYIPAWEKPLTVDVIVASYQDTITSFMLMYNVYEGYPAICRLYKDKYIENAAKLETHEDAWGDRVARSGNQSLIWTFKNQTIRMTDFYREERENYVKNPNMKYPENRYGVRYTKYFQALTIIYSDIRQCAKVEKVEASERAVAQQAQAKRDAEIAAQQERERQARQERAKNQDF